MLLHLTGQPHSALIAKYSLEGPIENDVQGLQICGATSGDVEEDHARVSLLGPGDKLLAGVDCVAVHDDDPELGPWRHPSPTWPSPTRRGQ